MRRKLFILSFFCLSAIFPVIGQSDFSVSGAWKVTSKKNNSEEIVLTRTNNLKLSTSGFSLNSDSSALRVLYIPGCGMGKKRPKGIKGKWRSLPDNIIEITCENPYEENCIVEKFRIVKNNARKIQLVRIQYEEIPNKKE